MNTNFLEITGPTIGFSYADFAQVLLNNCIQNSNTIIILNNAYFNVFDLQSNIQYIPNDMIGFI